MTVLPGQGEGSSASIMVERVGAGWGVGEWFLVDHRIALRTVVYIFPGAEMNLDNQEENKKPQSLRPKKLNFKSSFKGRK